MPFWSFREEISHGSGHSSIIAQVGDEYLILILASLAVKVFDIYEHESSLKKVWIKNGNDASWIGCTR